MRERPNPYELITLRSQLTQLAADLHDLHDPRWRLALDFVRVLDELIAEGCR